MTFRISVLIEELLSDLIDQLHIGTTETIDALLGVAHPVALLHQVGEALENLQLYGTGVLELVDHHELIGTLDFFNNLRHAEQFEEQAFHVVIVDDVALSLEGVKAILPLLGNIEEDGNHLLHHTTWSVIATR